MSFFKSLFIEHGWKCFYRPKGHSVLENTKASCNPFKPLLTSWRYWCADPFIVKENDKHYVFCELMDIKTSHGLLGLAQLNPLGNTYVYPIADLGCHMSYPNIFKVDGTWYMIPETNERKTIELYSAIHFPDQWTRKAVLTENIVAADTTIFIKDGQYYVFIYEPDSIKCKLSIAKLNLAEGKLDEKHLVKEYDTKIGRPAGNVWMEHGKYYRPVQSGIKMYGEKMFVYQFDFNIQTGKYTEHLVKSLSLNDFNPKLLKKNFVGCHTYNANEEFEIIDTTYARFSLYRPLRLVLKYLRIGGFCFHD